MMMLPSSSSASNSATVRVEKATSEFLIGPDWTLNIDICDAINLNHWLAKDIVKALKKRLQHKNPHVHLLSLTLLETMVKNCGDHVHSQIVERNILQDMIKIVKKKTNMSVREKILVLLDSWQEAFGGAGGRYPQYYWAYDELRRSGVEFPQRASDSALIFTPPVTHSTAGHANAGYGMPSNSSTRLDEAMASEVETLSLSGISSMHEVLDLLSAMLQAVDPNDRTVVNDEVIVDLVDRCRSNHKKLMQMLTTTGDEELLLKGLELNDSIQNELAKHDAIAAGHPLPAPKMNSEPQSTEVPNSSPKGNVDSRPSSSPNVAITAPSIAETNHAAEEEEDEDDDFAQLARRHSRTQTPASHGTFVGASETEPSLSNALALPDPPVPVKTTKEQDMIDFLSLTLSTTGTSPHTPVSSPPNIQQASVSPSSQGYPYAPQTYTGNQEQIAFNSYVAPWAQPQPQPQPQTQPQPQYQPRVQPQVHSQYQPQVQPQPHSQYQPQVQPQQQVQQQYQPQFQPQPQYQPQVQPQPQPLSQPSPPSPLQPQSQTRQLQQSQFQTQGHSPSVYPPPPWAATPGYYSNSTQQSYRPMQGASSPQQVTSPYTYGNNGPYVAGDAQMRPGGNAPAAGQKAFVPTYRLFEDLNVLGNGDGRSKTNTSPTLSGTSQSMVGGRK